MKKAGPAGGRGRLAARLIGCRGLEAFPVEDHGYVVTDVRHVHIHAVVGALHDPCHGKAGGRLLRHRMFAQRGDVDIEGHRLCDVLDGRYILKNTSIN